MSMIRWTSLVILAGLLALTPAPIEGAEAGPRNLMDGGDERMFNGASAENWLIAVGVDQFDDPKAPTLRFCEQDARAIHGIFTGPGRIVPENQSFLLVSGARDGASQPTRSNILRRIEDVARRAVADSTIILHLSGHGFIDDEGRTYLFPQDGDLDRLEETAVPVGVVNSILASSQARRKLLFVDACRNPVPRSGVRSLRQTVNAAAFNEALKGGQGQVTLASCDAGQVSNEAEELGHGVFTYFLLRGLRGAAGVDSNGHVTFSRLLEYVGREVPAWSRANSRPIQEPWMWGSMSGAIPLSDPANLPGGQAPAPDPQSPVVTVPDTGPTAPPPVDPAIVPPAGGPDRERPAPQEPNVRNYALTGGVQIPMVWVPAEVNGPGFWMSQTLITQAQYQSVMRARHTASVQGAQYPVDLVTWEDANTFCQNLSRQTGTTFQLPTEGQWVRACGSLAWIGFGPALAEAAWHVDNSGGRMQPVATRAPNEYGLYDMLGNAWEWCREWYDSEFRLRVVRGGAYLAPPSLTQVETRQGRMSDSRSPGVGFRVVIEP